VLCRRTPRATRTMIRQHLSASAVWRPTTGNNVKSNFTVQQAFWAKSNHMDLMVSRTHSRILQRSNNDCPSTLLASSSKHTECQFAFETPHCIAAAVANYREAVDLASLTLFEFATLQMPLLVRLIDLLPTLRYLSTRMLLSKAGYTHKTMPTWVSV
jgi:hypothetical protein